MTIVEAESRAAEMQVGFLATPKGNGVSDDLLGGAAVMKDGAAAGSRSRLHGPEAERRRRRLPAWLSRTQ